MKFIEYGSGLYHDAATAVQPISNENVIDYSFVSTAANNKAQFPRRKIEGADKARALYQKIGRPSQQQFKQNCPVTVDDAKRALLIYGPDVAAIKGKTTKGPSQHVPTFNPVQVPGFILQHHSDVTLCMDIFYVKGHPFFHTISRKVQFRTVAPVLNRNKATLLREIKPVLAMYKSRGFNISDLHADMEFECIRNDVLPSRLNVTAANKRSIRTMKERARTTIHGLPFKRLPKLMIQAVVYHAAKGLNQFPAKNGISDTLSPLTIMTGRANPDYNDLKLDFGSYLQVFEDNTPTNTTTSRNTGAIVLSPTGNAHGDYFFMSLVTGKRLSRHQWTEIPMTNAVISAVEAMAEKEGQPLIKGGVNGARTRLSRIFWKKMSNLPTNMKILPKIILIRPNPTMMLSRSLTTTMTLNPLTTMMLASRMTMKLMIPPFLSLIPMILGLMNLIPTPTKAPRQTTIPETKIPEAMLLAQTWSLTQTKVRVPIGTILGATEADPTVTDSITKWMTP
jgi:hypothetical protein